MSYANRRPTNMHCKVCESAKKPMNVITSHNPRNRDGFTVCPTLLAQQCRGCGKKGHTIGYCPKEQKEKERADKEQREKEQQLDRKKENKKKKMPEVKYDVLYESSDDEKEQAVAVAVIPQKKVKKVKDPNAKFCWATAESDSSGSESESD